jgi:hypothetical protein
MMKLVESGLPGADGMWSAASDDVAIDINEHRWLTFETASNGERMLTLFTLCPWTLLDAAERALCAASLRERSGRVLAVGIYREALVVSTRLGLGLSQPEVEAAVSELARFSDMCLNA